MADAKLVKLGHALWGCGLSAAAQFAHEREFVSNPHIAEFHKSSCFKGHVVPGAQVD